MLSRNFILPKDCKPCLLYMIFNLHNLSGLIYCHAPERRSRRIESLKEHCAGLIHRLETNNIREVNRRLHHKLKTESLFFQNCGDIANSLCALPLNIVRGEFSGCQIQQNLSRNKESSVCINACKKGPISTDTFLLSITFFVKASF